MQITFLGHAGFLIQDERVTIAIDPFIKGNPSAPDGINIQPDYILVTHGHGDHAGDAIDIAKKSGSTIVSVFELANYCARQGVRSHAMHIGGSYDFGSFRLKLTQALHGNSTGSEHGPAEYLGNPCGFLLTMGDKTLYHAGDTGLFGDMELIGKFNNINLALLPIGDNFTMGPEDAVEAVKMLSPHQVIPMHYNTWPLIAQDAKKFKREVEEQTMSKVVILQPGEKLDLK